jgi:flavin reductase (DIM6/NTAB) family NADH-FMN oxidoreductase RutF
VENGGNMKKIRTHNKTLWKPGNFVNPVPAVLVTSGDMKNSNIMTVAWTGTICSDPAMTYISVRPNRYSYKLIKESGEFVINLTTRDLTFATDWCGVKSGKDIDKFKEMHLTKQKANFVKCPLIAESPVSIECKVVEIKELGSHDMFIAEVLGINASNEYIDEKGAFDISKCDLIAYANGGYYTLDKKIGKFGYSVEKKKKK